MGGGKSNTYDDWLWCSFTLNEVKTAKITASNSMQIIDRVIVDDVELTMANSITQELGAGQHKVMWHLTSSRILSGRIPEVLSANTAKTITVNIPASVDYIGSMAMRGIPFYAPNKVVVRAATPPECENTTSIGLWSSANFRVYVPDASINAYKDDAGWSQYARWIVGLSTF